MSIPQGGVVSDPSASRWPRVRIVDETMREGMQIEDVSISTDAKLDLLDALSATGLPELVIGSFVSARWVPQMADVETLLQRFTPAPGVRYTALALNAEGVRRRAAYAPPLFVDAKPRLSVTACDVFAQRNTNRTQRDELNAMPAAVRAAVETGAASASVRLSAAFGSNWVGDIPVEYGTALLEHMIGLWTRAGIVVDTVWLGDPMGWNSPRLVERYLEEITTRWPSVRTVHLHLHDQRGAALVSAYTALRMLPTEMTLTLDAALGGVGGCPYCGNGRATGMIATEDLVDVLEESGIATGVSRERVIEAALLAAEVFGRPLRGRTPLAGGRPRGRQLYPMDLPLVETVEDAAHFRTGAESLAGNRSPWREPITSWQRQAAEDSGSLAAALAGRDFDQVATWGETS
jgi:hydroxymethylglutaryl-CoA lyase